MCTFITEYVVTEYAMTECVVTVLRKSTTGGPCCDRGTCDVARERAVTEYAVTVAQKVMTA